MNTPLHDIDSPESAFTQHTYKSLFDQERKSGNKKHSRQKTSLTFHEPKSLFTSDDIFADLLKTN